MGAAAAAAAASSSLHGGLQEEATCSICLEYFHDPVIIECGHNFCQACLAKCWGGSEGEEEVACPQCRRKVQRKLILNLQLGNMVEFTKKLCLQEEKTPQGKGGSCGKHQKPLKFCENDKALLCEACDNFVDHSDHQLVSLEKAAQNYKSLISRHLEFLVEERTKILTYKTEIEEKGRKLFYETKAEIENTKEQFREIQSFLERQEKLLLSLLEKVEKETARKRDDLLARLSGELSSLEGLIQEMNEKYEQPPCELLQDVSSILQSCEKKQPFQDLLAFRSEQRLEIIDVRKRNKHLAELLKLLKDKAFSQPLLQKANFTLDPNTAHPRLVLSEDGKSVNYGNIKQTLPNNPERFDSCPYVLGYVGFVGGRRYWEVTVRQEGNWAVGVARKTIERKGNTGLGINNGIWAIGTIHPPCYVSSDNYQLSVTNTRRIRVSLNCEEGILDFHDGDTGSLLHSFSGCPFFGENLLPFFSVFGRASLTITS